MTEHFHPQQSEIVHCFRFNSHVRHPGESVAMYVAEIKRLAVLCNFKDTLDEMLRDRIVCRIADERWQQRLLSEKELTYESALELVLRLDGAEKQVKDLHPPQPVQVHSVEQHQDLPRKVRQSAPTLPDKSKPNGSSSNRSPCY